MFLFYSDSFTPFLNNEYANSAEAIALIGIRIVVPARPGDTITSRNCKPIVKASGSGTSFKSFVKYLYAKAPNKAVKAVLKAGAKVSLSKNGVSGASKA